MQPDISSHAPDSVMRRAMNLMKYLIRWRIRTKARSVNVKEKTVRVLTLGRSGIGKTALIKKLCGMAFEKEHTHTLYDVHETTVKTDDANVKFQFMDLGAPYVYPAMLDVFIQKADMFLLVYSADDPQSFSEMEEVREKVVAVKHKYTADLVMFVVCNKSDLVEKKKITVKNRQQRQSVFNWCSPYMSVDTSAKSGQNVNAIMEKMIEESKFIGNNDVEEAPIISGRYMYKEDEEAVKPKWSRAKKLSRSFSLQYHKRSLPLIRRLSNRHLWDRTDRTSNGSFRRKKSTHSAQAKLGDTTMSSNNSSTDLLGNNNGSAMRRSETFDNSFVRRFDSPASNRKSSTTPASTRKSSTRFDSPASTRKSSTRFDSPASTRKLSTIGIKIQSEYDFTFENLLNQEFDSARSTPQPPSPRITSRNMRQRKSMELHRQQEIDLYETSSLAESMDNDETGVLMRRASKSVFDSRRKRYWPPSESDKRDDASTPIDIPSDSHAKTSQTFDNHLSVPKDHYSNYPKAYRKSRSYPSPCLKRQSKMEFESIQPQSSFSDTSSLAEADMDNAIRKSRSSFRSVRHSKTRSLSSVKFSLNETEDRHPKRRASDFSALDSDSAELMPMKNPIKSRNNSFDSTPDSEHSAHVTPKSVSPAPTRKSRSSFRSVCHNKTGSLSSVRFSLNETEHYLPKRRASDFSASLLDSDSTVLEPLKTHYKSKDNSFDSLPGSEHSLQFTSKSISPVDISPLGSVNCQSTPVASTLERDCSISVENPSLPSPQNRRKKLLRQRKSGYVLTRQNNISSPILPFSKGGNTDLVTTDASSQDFDT